MNTDELRTFLQESNAIEGITSPPTDAQIQAAQDFLKRPKIRVIDLIDLAKAIQPGAVLRTQPGMNVRVGKHYPPLGGPDIQEKLERLLAVIAYGATSPWDIHLQYERLHPFIDGNGRTGRLLWLWMMQKYGQSTKLGFLHTFYYQTLVEQ